MGQSRHFGPVRRMSACPLTAARKQTFRDRSFGPGAVSCTQQTALDAVDTVIAVKGGFLIVLI